MSREVAPVEKWQLDYDFKDKNGDRITCDRSDCTIGSYLLDKQGWSEFYGPGCTTCEFNGSVGDVFNEAEPRFEPGAPEDFKRAAALILTQCENPLIETIRTGRPATAAMIEQYAQSPSTT